MRQKSGPEKQRAEAAIKDIRRATRRHFSAEDKIRIVLEGLRGEDSIAELCRREGIVQNLYYRWSKDFLEAGKKRLAGDTARAATSDEVKELRREAGAPGRPPDILDDLFSRCSHRPGFLSHLRSLIGYDEPEILPSSTRQICLIGADAGHNHRLACIDWTMS